MSISFLFWTQNNFRNSIMGSILGLFKEMESMEPIVVQPIKKSNLSVVLDAKSTKIKPRDLGIFYIHSKQPRVSQGFLKILRSPGINEAFFPCQITCRRRRNLWIVTKMLMGRNPRENLSFLKRNIYPWTFCVHA